MAEAPRQEAEMGRGGVTTDTGDVSSVELLRSIGADSTALVRKEIELGRQEIVEAVTARIKAMMAGAIAGIFALLALIFLALSVSAALDNLLRPWASRLLVTGVFLLLVLAAFGFSAMRARKPSLAPEETKRSVKEDVGWAKAQLKR